MNVQRGRNEKGHRRNERETCFIDALWDMIRLLYFLKVRGRGFNQVRELL